MTHKNKITSVLTGLALACSAGFFFSSCTNPSSPGTGVPTNVQVTSATATSVTVSWTRDASDTGPDTVFVMSGVALAGSSVAQSPNSSAVVTGLTMGVGYTISVHSSSGASTSINYTIAGPPTNLMVNSASATSIGAKWTRGAGDNGADTIVAMNGSTVAGTAIVSSGSTGVVTGLSEGISYSISVHTSSGATSGISWMTAQRSTGITIYESGDPSASDPSALVLASNATDAIPLTGASNADFVLQSDGSVPSGITFEAGAVRNGAWNDDKINGRGDYIVGGLNNDYRSTDYRNDMDTASANAYDIPNSGDYRTQGSRVLIVKTQDAHLALIEIQPDPTTGNLYSTNAAGYKYITVNVSYQSAVNQPYAARPHRPAGGLVPKSLAH